MTDAPHISPLDQARILSEALPHMQEYDEETIVIKYGGHAMGAEDIAKDLRDLCAQVARLQRKIHDRRLDALIPWVDALRRRVEGGLATSQM